MARRCVDAILGVLLIATPIVGFLNFGRWYTWPAVTVGCIAAVLCWERAYERLQAQLASEEAPSLGNDALGAILAGTVLGLTWPVLPFVIARKAYQDVIG